MSAFYTAVHERLARLPGRCENRGECCRFGAYGHRLFVTFLETAWFLACLKEAGDATAADSAKAGAAIGADAGEARGPADDACPFARGGVCVARRGRPLGCRVFLCDPAARDWQGPVSEELLGELRALHRRLGVPYFYAEWMTVLAAVGLR